MGDRHISSPYLTRNITPPPKKRRGGQSPATHAVAQNPAMHAPMTQQGLLDQNLFQQRHHLLEEIISSAAVGGAPSHAVLQALLTNPDQPQAHSPLTQPPMPALPHNPTDHLAECLFAVLVLFARLPRSNLSQQQLELGSYGLVPPLSTHKSLAPGLPTSLAGLQQSSLQLPPHSLPGIPGTSFPGLATSNNLQSALAPPLPHPTHFQRGMSPLSLMSESRSGLLARADRSPTPPRLSPQRYPPERYDYPLNRNSRQSALESALLENEAERNETSGAPQLLSEHMSAPGLEQGFPHLRTAGLTPSQARHASAEQGISAELIRLTFMLNKQNKSPVTQPPVIKQEHMDQHAKYTDSDEHHVRFNQSQSALRAVDQSNPHIPLTSLPSEMLHGYPPLQSESIGLLQRAPTHQSIGSLQLAHGDSSSAHQSLNSLHSTAHQSIDSLHPAPTESSSIHQSIASLQPSQTEMSSTHQSQLTLDTSHSDIYSSKDHVHQPPPTIQITPNPSPVQPDRLDNDQAEQPEKSGSPTQEKPDKFGKTMIKVQYNQRVQNLKSMSLSSNRAAYRNQATAMHQAQAGSIKSPGKSLDILRQLVQKYINKDIETLIASYMEKYFTPAIDNIRKNNGSSSVPEKLVTSLCHRILDGAKQLYPCDDSACPSPAPDSDNQSETGSALDTHLSRFKRKRRGSDASSDASLTSVLSKKRRRVAAGNGRSTPSKQVKIEVKREGPKWDPERMTSDSRFIMGPKANKMLGLGKNRGKMYTKHPDMFKYAGDTDDKSWLVDQAYMPPTGAKAYLVLLDDILNLVDSEPEYSETSKAGLYSCSFTVPDWFLAKMKTCMNNGRTDVRTYEEPASPATMREVATAPDDDQYSEYSLPFTQHSTDGPPLPPSSPLAGIQSPYTEEALGLSPPPPATTETDPLSPLSLSRGFTMAAERSSDIETVGYDDHPPDNPFSGR